MINDQSIVSTHQSSILSRHAVITFFLTCMRFFLDMHFFLGTRWSLFSRHSVIHFFLNMHATSGQQAGNLRTSSKTLKEDWKASGSLGKLLRTVRNCWKPSFWEVFYTFSSRNGLGIGFLSSRIAGNDRLGLGNSKIEVLAKNGRLGEPGGAWLGEPGGAAEWTQHINNESKNPISRA